MSRIIFTLLISVVTLVSCIDAEDTSAPRLEVSTQTIRFDEDGKPDDDCNGIISILANRPWRAAVSDDADWVKLSGKKGDGDGCLGLKISKSKKGRTAEVTIWLYNSADLRLKVVKVTVLQGEGAAPVVEIFRETFGTTAVKVDAQGNPDQAGYFPFVDAYTGWSADNITYSGNNTSVRTSGIASAGYDGASGGSGLWFGGAPATFTAQNIALDEEQVDLRLTFGSQCGVNTDGAYDNTFQSDKLTVAVSADGSTWEDLEYDVNDGDAAHPYWVQGVSDFTFEEAVDELYVRFTCTLASAFRLDDVVLSTGNGGQEIAL